MNIHVSLLAGSFRLIWSHFDVGVDELRCLEYDLCVLILILDMNLWYVMLRLFEALHNILLVFDCHGVSRETFWW